MSGFEVTKYQINIPRLTKSVRIAVLADLHSGEKCDVDGIVSCLRENSPDLILMPGDTFERLDGSYPERKQKGFELISRAFGICPVYMSVGNHENGGTHSWNFIKWHGAKSSSHYFDKKELLRIAECGGVLLDNTYVECGELRIGGLSSGFINAFRKPRLDWLGGFCSGQGVKILMCHHPEYFEPYLKEKDIDLVVSGHAHGGQWRIFGRGVFAPGQGIFPKYTQGLHFGRHVISRGLKRASVIPRFFNKPEIVFIDLKA